MFIRVKTLVFEMEIENCKRNKNGQKSTVKQKEVNFFLLSLQNETKNWNRKKAGKSTRLFCSGAEKNCSKTLHGNPGGFVSGLVLEEVRLWKWSGSERDGIFIILFPSILYETLLCTYINVRC
jgi:hypothetical protein